VSFGQSSGLIEPISPTLLAQKGSLFLTRPTLFDYVADRADLEQAAAELFYMVSGGKLRVEIGQRFALENAADAHRALEARATTGSTILTV
jgi:NADPH:quinone reductase